MNIKLDSIQYLIITLIERIKDHQPHHNIPPALTKVQEVLVKDFYVIKDRSVETNLEQLEIFSLLLIEHAENINNPNNNKQIDFSHDKFIQHITQFINHGLPENLQERNNFYLQALEKSITELEDYRDANCINNNFIDAISYHLARIGEIRNQFSHRFKLDNNFLLNNLFNDDFRAIRNSLVHGSTINHKILSATIDKVHDIAKGIQNNIAAKNNFIKDDFKPIFIG